MVRCAVMESREHLSAIIILLGCSKRSFLELAFVLRNEAEYDCKDYTLDAAEQEPRSVD